MKQEKLKTNQICEQESNNLYDAFASIKNAKEAKLFLEDLCTPSEIEAMWDRWAVVAPINAKKSYRQIHTETGVSVTTIGRIARSLSFGEGGYNLIFKRLERKNAKNK